MAGPTAAAGLARGFDGGVVADLGWTRRAAPVVASPESRAFMITRSPLNRLRSTVPLSR